MNNKIKLKIFGTVLAIILTFIVHNLYTNFPCFITSVIAPVNESIHEHMKVLFTSILFAGICQKIIVIIKKLNIKNVCISNFTAAITSIPIFLIMFLPIYLNIGENFVITIIIMIIAIIISEYISYKIMNLKDLKMENKTIILAILTFIIFGILTYYPPKLNYFKDPLDNNYGIKK